MQSWGAVKRTYGAVGQRIAQSPRQIGDSIDRPSLRYFRGVDPEQVALFLRRVSIADMPAYMAPEVCCSAHFPVGRFPGLYPESETRSGAGQFIDAYNFPTMIGGRQRSRFYLPLMRASWRRAAKRKPTQWEILEGGVRG